jgi:tetratricopeptide (TPR) repeat protein
MGTVFRAVDKLDGTTVALKLLRGQHNIDIERFEREAAALSDLRHPGIVRYVAHGRERSGERYLAMEWLEGEDLASRILRRGLDASQSLRVVRRAALALAFAHARGLIHRDVKPSNIFIVEDDVDRIKLVDFGIAHVARDLPRLTGTGVVLGTPGYMSPEQLEGSGASDPRIDVFSLGCVLFECLTGRPAFEGAHVMAVLAKILLQETPCVHDTRPDVPEPLDEIVAKMMAKAPEDRYADGAAVLLALESVGEIDLGPPSRAPPRPGFAVTLPQTVDRAPISIGRNEQRLVTVVFAGDPDADASVPARQATPALEASLGIYGGHLTELPGRSLLVTQWGAGGAVDRAERAAQCALMLRAHLPDLAICVATGRGLISARVIEGEIIDRGVRMLTRTRPGLIRLDDTSANMLSPRVEVVRQGNGFALAGNRIERHSAPQLLGRPSAFLGRSRELSTLEGVLSGCIAEPVASAVLVIGPAGSGKSRLRREFLEKVRARSDAVEIITGGADSLCPGTPYGIVSDVVRRAAGIGDGDPMGVKRNKLRERVGQAGRGRERENIAAFLGELIGAPFAEDDDKALRAARENAMLMGDAMRAAWEAWLAAECAAHPVLLVLEDLHWADAASVRLVDSTLRNLRDTPLMVLVLARPEVNAQFPGLWAERDVQTIKLGPLARKAADKLVRDALGSCVSDAVVTRVLDRAEGNPFYLEELVRAVAAGRTETLPDSVLGTVEARLDAEGSEAKRILRAASVFGDRFSRAAVAFLLGGGVQEHDVASWLATLAAHELVTPTGAPGAGGGDVGYAFSATLVREAAYAMLTDADRTVGHRLAGEWLEQHGSPDATALAEHFVRGGEPWRSVRWYARAAEQALEANELTAAIEQAERGVACGAAGEDLGGLRLVQAEANVWRGELALAEERGLEALRLLRAGSSAWFRAVAQLVNAAGKQGRIEPIEAWVEQATLAAPAPGALGLKIASLSWAAMYLIFGGRYDTADSVLQKIGRAADISTLAPQTAAILQQSRAVRALIAGDSAAGLEGLLAAVAATEETGDRRTACSIRSNLGFILAELGDFRGAEEALRVALADADGMGLHDVAMVATHNLGHVLAYLGRLDEARMLEQRAIEAFRKQGDPRMEGTSRSCLGKIALLAGDLATAEVEARAAAEALRVAPPLRATAVATLARVYLAQGRAAEALPVAREAYETLEELGMIEEGESLVRLVYAEALRAAGLRSEFAAAITDARDRLMARAEKISDPEWRGRFLTAVPDNARTLALARSSPGLVPEAG